MEKTEIKELEKRIKER